MPHFTGGGGGKDKANNNNFKIIINDNYNNDNNNHNNNDDNNKTPLKGTRGTVQSWQTRQKMGWVLGPEDMLFGCEYVVQPSTEAP